jgi:hypothetical protein
MIPFSYQDVQIIIAATVFLLGCLCLVLGTFVLIHRGYSKEIRALATHTARLGQKGLAEELGSLVSSTSQLVSAINSLIRTASGIGVFLIMLGLVMIAGAYWIIEQIALVSA